MVFASNLLFAPFSQRLNLKKTGACGFEHATSPCRCAKTRKGVEQLRHEHGKTKRPEIQRLLDLAEKGNFTPFDGAFCPAFSHP
jgi:hypothetical protein